MTSAPNLNLLEQKVIKTHIKRSDYTFIFIVVRSFDAAVMIFSAIILLILLHPPNNRKKVKKKKKLD